MTGHARVAIACCLCLLLAESSQAQEFREDIDGRWEGFVSVTGNDAEGDPGERPIAARFQMRMVISPGGMTVIVFGSDTWGFSGGHVMRIDPSAVVSSVTGADDRTDTWTVSVTKRDENSLLVFLSLFANPGGPESQMTDISAIAATGVLSRIRDD